MRYRCIDRRRNQYTVAMMCRVLRVSKSGYYAWRVRPESQRDRHDRELLRVIRRIHADSRQVYGRGKVTAELRAQGYDCGERRVGRLMGVAGLRGCPQRRFKVTTQSDPKHSVAPNLIEQDFTAKAPNERWASDITYIGTRRGWLYLAVVMDLYSRRIVCWSKSQWMSRHLAVDALRMAIGTRQPTSVLIHHSDRGSQYTSDDYRDELEKHQIRCSMSATGNCYDNAVVESFFGLLKRERVNRVRYRDPEDAKADLFEYIECFYNRKRRHGYLGNISPVEFESKTEGRFETVH